MKRINLLREVEDVIIEEVSKEQDYEVIISSGILTDKLVMSRTHGKQIGKTTVCISNSMSQMMKKSKMYKSLSVRAAKYFYLIVDLVKLNNMYQFTHEWFKKFFQDFLHNF